MDGNYLDRLDVALTGTGIATLTSTMGKKECIARWREKNKGVIARQDRERREKLKELGLCRDCPAPTRPGRVCCQNCADRRTQKMKERRDRDPRFMLATTIRNRLGKAIAGGYKAGSAVRDLGCTIKEFQDYVASKFEDGMSWYNHGEWHLDHVKPLASFNLENREEFLEVAHYTNYQPLWAKENLRKGAVDGGD